MDSTLYELAQKCKNEIRLIGTLSELNLDSYEKNGVLVVKYKGVVQCNNAFISIKSTLTSYDSTIVDFVKQFSNNEVIGRKVYIIGKLNSLKGINVSYMSCAYDKEDYFKGDLIGVAVDNKTLLIVNNEYHDVLTFDSLGAKADYQLGKANLTLNKLVVKDDIIINEGMPPIVNKQRLNIIDTVDKDLVAQALDEHEIYLEAMRG